MYFLKKLNENYYIYIILIFVFVPLNFLPQLNGGVMFDYAYEIGDIGGIELMHQEMGRYYIFFVFILLIF